MSDAAERPARAAGRNSGRDLPGAGHWIADLSGSVLERDPSAAAIFLSLDAGEERRFESDLCRSLEHNSAFEGWYFKADGATHPSVLLKGSKQDAVVHGLIVEIVSISAGRSPARNQEFVESLTSNLPVMLMVYEPETREFQVNREFTRVLGWTQEEMNQPGALQRCYPERQERARALEFMSSAAPGWRDFRVTAKSGELVASSWANIRLSGERNLGIGIDLRERLATERVLRESEARLKFALEAGGLGTFEYGFAKEVLIWSDLSKSHYGLPPDAPIDLETAWKALPQEDAGKLRAAMHRALNSASGKYVVEHRTAGIADSVERWIATWGSVVTDSSGKPIGFRGVTQDITARKLAEQEIHLARAREEILMDVVRSLLTSESPPGIIRDLARKLMAATGADVFFNFLLDGKTGGLTLNSSVGIPSEAIERFRFIPVSEAANGSDASEVDARSGRFQAPDLDSLRAENIRAYSFYPLQDRHGVLGTIGFASRSLSQFAQEDLDLMQAVADYYSIALRRRQEQTALQASEERYRTIARNIPAGGVWVVDRDLSFVAVEGPLALRFQASGGFHEGDVLDERSAEGQAARVAWRFRQALAGEELSVESEYRGVSVWTHYGPVRDERGEIVAALALALDITERKRAEAAFQQSEQRERARAAELQAIMDAVPAAAWVARDRECKSITSNRFGYEILALPPGSNVSLSAPGGERPANFQAFINGKNAGADELPMQVAARTGVAVRDCQMEIRFEGGGSRVIFGSAIPLLDAAGEPTGSVGAFIDITERLRLDEQLSQAQKLESIGVLAGGVAHDFNNLLTGMLGNASLALLDAPPTVAQRLTRIVDAAEKAAGLTRQLLAYAGKGQFLISDVDVARVIRSSADLFQLSVTRNIEVNLESVPVELCSIRADSTQLQQVVMNLVLNASEAIGPKTAGQIHISAGIHRDEVPPASPNLPAGDYVFIRVQDNGCGMPDETLSKIFDPFFTTKFTGRGLGLAAVQGIMRSLKGAIRVESSLGQGSTFTVFLPCILPAAQGGHEEKMGGEATALGRNLRVLVVDDEAMVREMAQAALEKFGYRVSLAGNGESALDFLRTNGPVDLVLLDVIMPVMDGTDLLFRIRESWPQTRVLLTSGFDREEANRVGEMGNEVPFIQKPYTIQQLQRAVAEALA